MMNKDLCRNKTVILTTLLLLANLPHFSWAVDDKIVLEEVIVTAQKREQRMQDVPLIVSAVTGEQLENSGVGSFQDLEMSVPGLIVNNSTGLILPFIRGVGSLNSGGSNYTSVAVYVDGVYAARNNAMNFVLDNVEQIEVLKGPQSTLYGRNATGGAITIQTAKPMPGDTLSGTVKVSAGNFKQRRYNVHISGGQDVLAASLTGAIVKRDGYVENLAHGNEFFSGTIFEESHDSYIDDENEKMLVGKVTFAPNDDVELVLTASYHEAHDTKGFNWRPVNALNFMTAFFGGPTANALAGLLPSKEYASYHHWGDRDIINTSVSLAGRFDFKDMYLVSLSSYTNNLLTGGAEVGHVPVALFGFEADWDSTAISQELRLHSDSSNKLQWMIGADYYKEGDDQSRIWNALGPTFADATFMVPSGTFPNGALPFTLDDPSNDADWEFETYSFFGELVYAASERMNLTFGLRHTEEEYSIADNRDGALFAAFGIPNVPLPSKTEKTDELTYRVVLDYDFDWGKVYLSRSTGFVTGVFNTANLAGKFVKPEKLLSHEIGVKSELADGPMGGYG